MWVQVPAATVAAVYDPLRGGIQPYDILEGWTLVPPWATVRYFSVRTQNYTMGGTTQEGTGVRDDAIICQTSEGLSVGIDATVLYQIAPGDAHKLWKTVGPDYIAVIVRPQVREATRIIISEYPIMSVYSNAPPETGGVANVDFYPGKRQEVEDRIFQRLQAHLADKGISLQRFLLRNVDYMQKEFEKAVVDKQVAQQNIVTQSYEADIQRIRAQANIVRAEGDSEAIRLKANALRVNPAVIKWEFIEKLPDDIDVVILPDRVMPLLDMGEKASAAEGQK
jgi:regulator of protease activity HflC (stomatin/prohibitin superfamily)